MQPRPRRLPQRPSPGCPIPHAHDEPLDEDLVLQRAAARLGRRGWPGRMLTDDGSDPVPPSPGPTPAPTPAPIPTPTPGPATIQLPASARDSINFCVASVNRNRFLQVPTGLFGGDDATLSTYSATDAHYVQSEVYNRAVTVWRPLTNVPLYAREPLPCWYAAGTLTLRDAPASATAVLRVPWTVSEGLWNTLRIPGQIITLVAHGRCCHCPLLTETSAALLVCQLPAEDPAYPVGSGRPSLPLFAAGDLVPYLLRARPPNLTCLGPVLPLSPTVIRVQVPGRAELAALEQAVAAPPPSNGVPGLCFLGARAAHPLYPCALDPPDVARERIYAVQAVQAVAPGVPLLRSAVVVPVRERWAQRTDHLAVGCLELDPAAAPVVTGYDHGWPYPADQEGEAWLLLRDAADAGGTTPDGAPPTRVWFVRVAAPAPDVVVPPGGGPLPDLDGVALVDGDRVARLDPATGRPADVVEVTGLTGLVPVGPVPPDTLVVVTAGALHGRSAWWSRPPTGAPAWNYRVAAHGVRKPAAVTRTVVDLTPDALGSASAPSDAALVLLARPVDGLYAPAPRATATNLYQFPWTYPVQTADGTDRWNASGLTSGLIVWLYALIRGFRRLLRASFPFFVVRTMRALDPAWTRGWL